MEHLTISHRIESGRNGVRFEILRGSKRVAFVYGNTEEEAERRAELVLRALEEAAD